jgi:hypothetical protein
MLLPKSIAEVGNQSNNTGDAKFLQVILIPCPKDYLIIQLKLPQLFLALINVIKN